MQRGEHREQTGCIKLNTTTRFEALFQILIFLRRSTENNMHFSGRRKTALQWIKCCYFFSQTVYCKLNRLLHSIWSTIFVWWSILSMDLYELYALLSWKNHCHNRLKFTKNKLFSSKVNNNLTFSVNLLTNSKINRPQKFTKNVNFNFHYPSK